MPTPLGARRGAPFVFASVLPLLGLVAQTPIAALGPLGGGGTVTDATSNAFGYPSPLLPARDRRAFAVGNAVFRSNWVTAPASAAGLDGLGPLFNARSCSSCHLKDGRSRPPAPGEPERHGLLIRIGVPVANGADLPHPSYGGQLQDAAIPGVQPEATLDLAWTSTSGSYADGEAFVLLSPRYRLERPAYGPLGDDVVLAGRTAPQLIGLGLLEAVPASTLRALADPDDRDRDGISGRLHLLDDGALGRFGWKATQPTVRAQTAGAFVHDMGVTSPDHPQEPLAAVQRQTITAPSGGRPEIDELRLARVVFYTSALAVPAQRGADLPLVQTGRQHFQRFGCAACHVETLHTGTDAGHPAFAEQTIHPFTDLLLHDLGPGLADGKRDGDASGAEWRTAPLWGIGLIETVNGHTRFLHDGRARDLAEAILWHGGEAETARERFRTAPAEQRAALLAFLRSL